MKRLTAEFFDCGCVNLSIKLLGKVICIQTPNEVIRKMINEVEAYGIGDTACHANKGRTKRNDPMFKSGGTVYVYLCYGIHEILNFSAGKDGEGQGVMIRAVCNAENIEVAKGHTVRNIGEAVGPGRVTKLLGIDRSFNYEFLPASTRIWLEEGAQVNQSKIQRLKRIGIGYASQADQDRLWRFKLHASPESG